MGHIYLIGFMGSGKSATGRALAVKTGWELVDTDREIEVQAGKTIPELFAAEGEQAFRKREAALMQRIRQEYEADGTGKIISCGGGIVLQEENISNMRRSGTIILLTASPEVILERVSRNDRRPVLAGRKTLPDIRAMMAERLPRYNAAADIRISTNKRETKRIAEKILHLCANTPAHGKP